MAEDKEKTIYLIQIQHLDRQLESLQLRSDELQLQNRNLVLGCSALVTDETDICEYLRHSMEPDLRTQELQEARLQAAQQEHRALAQQHGALLQDQQDRVQRQESETNTRAALFEEQRKELDEQEQRLFLLTEQQYDMQCEEEPLLRHKEALQSALRFREEILSPEAGTSHSKILELVREEKARHSRCREAFLNLLAQNEVLWTQIATLKVQKVELLQEEDDLSEDLKKLQLKICTLNKELENLRSRRQKLKEELNACIAAHEPLLEEDEALRQLLTSVSEQRHQKASEAHRLRAELQRECSSSGRLEAGMQEAVAVLRHILTDSRKMFRTLGERLLEILQSSTRQGPGSTSEESSDPEGPRSTPDVSSDTEGPASTPEVSSDPEEPGSTSEESSHPQGLRPTPEESSHPQGLRPTPEESSHPQAPRPTPKESGDPEGPGSTPEESRDPQEPGPTPEESRDPQGPGPTPEESRDPQGPGPTHEESSDPRTDRTKTLTFATDPLFLMARYRPGDLGFIPRPTWTLKAAASQQVWQEVVIPAFSICEELLGTLTEMPSLCPFIRNSANRRDAAVIQRPPPPQTDEPDPDQVRRKTQECVFIIKEKVSATLIPLLFRLPKL